MSIGGQGIIIWDITGSGSTNFSTGHESYLGDPRFLNPVSSGLTVSTAYSPFVPPASALGINGIEPAMEAIADSLFTSIRNSGLKCGVALRAQKVNVDGSGNLVPSGTLGSHQPNYNTIANQLADLDAKITYAYNRWGCRMFYVDSNAPSNDVYSALQLATIQTTTPAYVYTQLAIRHPDCLIIPEQYFNSAFSYDHTIQSNETHTNSSSLTNAFSVPNIAGNQLVVMFWVDAGNATVSSFSDSVGNTYSLVVTAAGGGAANLSCWMYFCSSCLSGTNTVTAVVNSSNGFMAMTVMELGGILALDQHSAGAGIGTAMSSGAITTTSANEIIISYLVPNNSISSMEVGWQSTIYTPFGEGLEYITSTSTGTFTGTATQTSSSSWVAIVASFSTQAGGTFSDTAYQYEKVASRYASINPVSSSSPYLTSPELTAVPDAFTVISCSNLSSPDPTDATAVVAAVKAKQAILMADVWYSDPSIGLVSSWMSMAAGPSSPISQLTSLVQPLLNTSVLASTQSLLTPNVNPPCNSILVAGSNSGPSTSLSVPTQGVNGNPCGRAGDQIPSVMCNLQNQILLQTVYSYRV